MENLTTLLFDIGGTKFRIGATLDLKTIGPHQTYSTPKDFHEGISIFENFIKEQGFEGKIKAIVGGFAGSFTHKNGVIWNSPHLPKWNGKDLCGSLKKLGKCPVLVENDTAIVGLGEATSGGGKDFKIVGYMTVSTGVNGVRIVNKQIDVSTHGFEIGHQIVDFDANSHFVDFGRGELEDFISGSAMEKRYKKSPFEINDNSIWEEVTKVLSIGIYNSILYWSPEVIVVGGAISKRISLEKVEEYLKSMPNYFPTLPYIRKSELGDLGGLYGALALSKEFRRYWF